MKKAVKNKKPLAASKIALDSMTETQIARGDYSKVGGNPKVLRQVKTEVGAESRGDADQDKSLCILQKKWHKEEVERDSLKPGTKRFMHAGFAHNIHAGFERSVDLYTHEAIRIYRILELAPTGIFTDYTGGIIAPQRDVGENSDVSKKVLHGLFSVATPKG
jgi:hypothetical protein